jgi:thermitase
MRRARLVLAAVAVAVSSLAGAQGAAAADYVPDQVIVKPAAGVDLTRVLALPGVQERVGSVDGVGAFVLRVRGNPVTVARALSRSPLVAYAEPNLILRATAIPNDARFGELYGLNNTGQTGGKPDADIDAPEGWDAAGLGAFPNSGGPRVGIVDTGIDQTHEDLAGKTVACAQSRGAGGLLGGSIQVGQCLDDNDHGTHVAGTITANANNGVGVAGVAFNSPLVICKALGGPLGTGSTSDVANCIAWTAQQGAKVISMSLGGGNSSTLKAAVDNAWANGNGTLLVAAAGNDGDSTANYPAAYDDVVSVAATDKNDVRASFSNANADVEIAAPGVAVLSTRRGGGYFTLSGTSMATPHVSGVAAVLFFRSPTATAATIRSQLDAAVDDLGPAGRDPSYGFGRVNLCKAAGGAC